MFVSSFLFSRKTVYGNLRSFPVIVAHLADNDNWHGAYFYDINKANDYTRRYNGR